MKIFGHHIPFPILMLLMTEFVFSASAFLLTSSFLLSDGKGVLVPMNFALAVQALLFGAVVVIGVTAMGLYQPKQRLGAEAIFVRLVAGLAVAGVALAIVDWVFPVGVRGPLWLVSLTASLLLLALDRAAFGKLVDNEAFRRRVLVLGAGDRAASLLKLRRRSDQRGFKIVAFVPTPGDRSRMTDERVRSVQGPLLKFAQTNDVNEIVVAMDERREGFPIKDLLDCKFAGIAVIDLLSFLERETGRVKVDLLNPAWLIFSDDFGDHPARRMASRLLDLTLSAVLVVCTIPVMLAVAIAILAEDGAPVLYRQQRVGLNGVPFTLLKFRSMVKNAESDGRAQWADRSDPRITRVGQVIRKLRFDELPQLFNVIRGNMSLVGPRPERPEFVESLVQKIPYYHERHSVKPGITGWAQLSYPYGSSEEDAMEKLQFDLYYVKHRSIIFDLMVLLQTVEVVVWGKGAR